MAVIVPAVASLAFGAFNAYQGSKKEKEAKRLAEANKRPAYQIPQGEKDNLALSGYLAQQGLSSGAKQYYLDAAGSGLSSSIEGILKGGGNPNDINKSFDSYLGNMSQVALVDDQRKLGNIQNLITERRRMGEQEDKAFQVNEYAPWADRQQALYEQRNSGSQQRQAGIGQAVSAVGSIAGGLAQNASTAKVKKGGGSGEEPVKTPSYGIPASTRHSGFVGPQQGDYSAPVAAKAPELYNVGGQPTSFYQDLSPEYQQLLFNALGVNQY